MFHNKDLKSLVEFIQTKVFVPWGRRLFRFSGTGFDPNCHRPLITIFSFVKLSHKYFKTIANATQNVLDKVDGQMR